MLLALVVDDSLKHTAIDAAAPLESHQHMAFSKIQTFQVQMQSYPSHQGCFCFSLCDLLMVFLFTLTMASVQVMSRQVQVRTDPGSDKQQYRPAIATVIMFLDSLLQTPAHVPQPPVGSHK